MTLFEQPLNGRRFDFNSKSNRSCNHRTFATSTLTVNTSDLFSLQSALTMTMTMTMMIAVGNVLLVLLRIFFELICCLFRREKYAHWGRRRHPLKSDCWEHVLRLAQKSPADASYAVLKSTSVQLSSTGGQPTLSRQCVRSLGALDSQRSVAPCTRAGRERAQNRRLSHHSW